jgi:hypothetical protein
MVLLQRQQFAVNDGWEAFPVTALVCEQSVHVRIESARIVPGRCDKVGDTGKLT